MKFFTRKLISQYMAWIQCRWKYCYIKFLTQKFGEWMRTTKCTEDKSMHSCLVSWFTQLHGCLWYWKCMQGWSVSRSKLLKCTSEAPVTYEQHSIHDCTYCKSIILYQTSGFKVCPIWKDLRLEQSPVASCWRKKWVPWQMATCSRP